MTPPSARPQLASARALTIAVAALLTLAACGPAGGASPTAALPQADAPSPTESAAGASPAAGEAEALPAPEMTTLRIGMSSSETANVPGMVTEAAGLYEEYGLSVELSGFDGAQQTIQALQAGQIDIADVSGGPVVASLATDRPLVMVLVIQAAFTQLFTVRPEIAEPDDLHGQSIGITGFGALTHAAVLASLDHLGVAETDVTITPVGGSSDRLAALVGGSIAASSFSLGLRPVLEEEGLEVLVDLPEDTDYEYPGGGIVVPVEFAEQNPNTVLAVVAANLAGLQRAMDDRDFAAQAYADFADIEVAEARDQVDIEFSAWERRDGRATEDMFLRAREVVAAVEPSLADIDVTAAYTYEYLDRLDELGVTEEIGVPAP